MNIQTLLSSPFRLSDMLREISAVIDHEIEVLQAQIAVLNRRGDDFVRILEDMACLRDSVKAESVALASQITELERQKSTVNWSPSELLIQIFLSSRVQPITRHHIPGMPKLALATSIF
jgi:ABC-type transporter Mla subunit MlaD